MEFDIRGVVRTVADGHPQLLGTYDSGAFEYHTNASFRERLIFAEGFE